MAEENPSSKMVEEGNNLIEIPILNINKSSAEYIEDNSNDEDNEDSNSMEEEQNNEDSNSVKTPPVKKCGRPKKIVKDNENKTSSVKRRGQDDGNNDGTKRMKKKMDHKEEKVKRKRNQKNNKRKFVDDSSSEFEVTTTSSKGKRHKKNIKISDEKKKYIKIRTRTTPTALFNAMAILNVDRKKCLYEMGFGSLIGMAIHELPGMLESFESRSADDPFIKEWFSQFGDKNEVRPNDITDDYIKMIKEKCYNIHQDLISVREKLDEGLSIFPDSKKLNMFREKFEETTTGIDNDDTTGIDKESYSPGCQMESDSPASDDDNQKSNFQVLFHEESGNSDLQRMKNKDRNEDVDHILNEDDKVDDSCPAAGFCSVIEGDEVILKGKGVKFIEKDNVLVDDVPKEKYSLNECDVVIQDENKDLVERSEHTLEKEKKKISNEELRSEGLKGNVGAEDAVDSQETIEDIFKQDEQIQSAEDVGCSIPDLDDDKLDVYNGPDLRSPYEYLLVDVKKPVSDVEKIVADTLFAMIGSKLDLIFESQSGHGLNHLEMETLTPTLMVSAYILVYYIGNDTDDKKLAVFIQKMKDSFNEDEKLMSLQNFEMIKVFVQYLYYVKHPKAEAIEKAKIKRMKMSWRTTHNCIDCGVFTMLHMESYIGAEGEWKCGLAKESKKQNEQLNSLRSKFAAKIILS
nr:hypothetical protein [Tanacetum cinerariifolium]